MMQMSDMVLEFGKLKSCLNGRRTNEKRINRTLAVAKRFCTIPLLNISLKVNRIGKKFHGRIMTKESTVSVIIAKVRIYCGRHPRKTLSAKLRQLFDSFQKPDLIKFY